MIGQPLRRREDLPLLRGRGRYVDDLDLSGLAHVAFVRSHHARARIEDIRLPARAPGLLRCPDRGGPGRPRATAAGDPARGSGAGRSAASDPGRGRGPLRRPTGRRGHRRVPSAGGGRRRAGSGALRRARGDGRPARGARDADALGSDGRRSRRRAGRRRASRASPTPDPTPRRRADRATRRGGGLRRGRRPADDLGLGPGPPPAAGPARPRAEPPAGAHPRDRPRRRRGVRQQGRDRRRGGGGRDRRDGARAARSNGSRTAWRTSSAPTRGGASRPTSSSRSTRTGGSSPCAPTILADLGAYLLPTTAIPPHTTAMLMTGCYDIARRGGLGARRADRQGADRSVPRRRPPRGRVLPRADRRPCRARAGTRPRRAPPAQPDPLVPVPQRARLDVRLGRLRARASIVRSSCAPARREAARGHRCGDVRRARGRQLGERASGRARATGA